MATDTLDELLIEHDMGQLNTDGSRLFREVLAAVRKAASDTGKAKGELTIKFGFSADNTGKVEVVGEVKGKAPGPRKRAVIAWIEGEALVSNDPRQTRLPLNSPRAPANDRS